MKAFSLKDTKANDSNLPFFTANRATAIREVTHGLRSNEQLRLSAPDFELWEVGTWDSKRMLIEGLDGGPLMVVNVGELVEE